MLFSLSFLLTDTPGEIEMNHDLAASKPDTTFRNRDAIRHHDSVILAPNLKFKTALVMELAALALDRLGASQRRAMEGICYNMEATDDRLDETYRIARRFEGALQHAERMSLAQRFLDEYEDAIVNLARTIEMCDRYLKGEQS
jgi:hypothetical protein